ncbi:hypothetical protein QBC47DRAFT_413938 [Echria macrotheca]|uniref:Uncharacterized protein n=1 Tax=Echria macrotheca TaxID=438768 RepID=A0AAJ0BB59_9PEZI|nr:hypothetical protein QBC47DRAFT_413938 [Echria macrotheca]
MKWSIAAAVLTASSLSTALPTVPGPDTLPYRLRLQSGNAKLNNQYLTTNGTAVGVFPTSTSSKPLLVYTITDKKTSLVELHTYPAGKDSRLLALVGEQSDGLLSLTNLPDPESIQLVPGSSFCDWKSFRLGNAGSSNPDGGRVSPKPGNSITWAGVPQGSWVAFPVGTSGRDYTVSFKGLVDMTADARYISIDMPIDVLYVPAYDVEDGVVTIMS